MADPATEYLDHYLDQNTRPDSAVLITGPWGSGKTHFVKRYLENRAAKLKARDPLNAPKHLYASLYGVKSTEEITAQFFAQAHPLLASKQIRLIGTVGMRILNALPGGEKIKGEDAKVFQDLATNLDGAVLVFDDLERCAMPIADVMGFINAYVEHEGLKALVLASEGDIPDHQQDEYRRRKEKLVGKTLAVRSDPQLVYDHFVARIQNPSARSAAEGARTELIELFLASGSANFRSLRAVLEDFERVVAAADPRLASSPDSLQELLRYMVAVGLELRAATIQPSQVGELSQVAAGLHPDLFKRDGEPSEAGRLRDLTQKYPTVKWGDPILPPDALAALYSSGELRVADINAHLAQHPAVVGVAATPAWRRLWSWTDLSRAEYETARAELLDDFAHRRMTSPAVILHAAGVLLSLKRMGDGLLGGRKVRTFIRNYAADLVAARLLQPDPAFSRHGGDDVTSWGGLGFASSEAPEFKEIVSDVVAAVDDALATALAAQAPQLLERIKAGSPYVYLYEHGYGGDTFGEVPILHHLPPAEVADLCLPQGTANQRLIASLSKRYTEYNRHVALRDEEPWTRSLLKELQRRIRTLKRPHRELAQRSVEQHFKKIEAAFGRLTSP